MATLDPGNIVNGNVIEPSDLLQLYDAFTSGGGTTGVYNVSISGSLTGSATTADTSTIAISASNITSTTTDSGVYYPLVVSGVGTKPPKIVSTFELSGSVLNNITASRAITASHALNAGTPNIVNVDTATGFNTPIGIQGLNMFAGLTDAFPGSTPNSQSVSMSLAFPSLTPPVVGFGTDIWINATPTIADSTITQPVYVDYNIASKVIHFITNDPTFNGNVVYTGYTKL
jgi:hypothetical protein